jgi:hypothetical protein
MGRQAPSRQHLNPDVPSEVRFRWGRISVSVGRSGGVLAFASRPPGQLTIRPFHGPYPAQVGIYLFTSCSSTGSNRDHSP